MVRQFRVRFAMAARITEIFRIINYQITNRLSSMYAKERSESLQIAAGLILKKKGDSHQKKKSRKNKPYVGQKKNCVTDTHLFVINANRR